MQVEGGFIFNAAPDWCFNVEYLVERERGFAYQEDLFQPGQFEIRLGSRQTSVPHRFDGGAPDGARAQRHRRGLAAGKSNARMGLAASSESLEGHLAREGERFLVRRPDGGFAVTAGYHWFGSWGRDTLIALPA